MRTRLVLPATLIALSTLAFAGVGAGRAASDSQPPAQALHRTELDRVGASDTGHASAVHADTRSSERWYCTPTGCAGARASSGSAAFGFAATTLAVVWISRKRPADRC